MINAFTDEEILRMIDVYKFTNFLEARNKMLMVFLIDTGARNSEVCSLLKQDVKERIILLRGKGNKERHVSISPMLKKHMIRYERIREFYFKDKILKHDNYFLSETGLPLTPETIQRVIRYAGKVADVRSDIRC
jgi:integrase/recombinase XerD